MGMGVVSGEELFGALALAVSTVGLGYSVDMDLVLFCVFF